MLSLIDIFKSFGFIPKEILAFIQNARTMNEIKKIKNAHDYSWMNKYLKNINNFKEIILSYQCKEFVSEVPVTAFMEFDNEMLQLYFAEILLSHSVKQSFVGNTYVFQLTPEYINH